MLEFAFCSFAVVAWLFACGVLLGFFFFKVGVTLCGLELCFVMHGISLTSPYSLPVVFSKWLWGM